MSEGAIEIVGAYVGAIGDAVGCDMFDIGDADGADVKLEVEDPEVGGIVAILDIV